MANECEVYEMPPAGFSPIVEVSGCYLDAGGELLLLQYERGVWGVPAGKLEVGETSEQAAYRELMEETGIWLEEPLAYVGHLYARKPGCDFVFHMFASILHGKPEVKLSKEHRHYCWVTPSEAENLPLIGGGIEAIQHYYRYLKRGRMGTQQALLDECHQLEGVVVVIDVIKAFTTAAIAFQRDVEKMVLVAEVEEARRQQEAMPEAWLIGEDRGEPLLGFQLDNSPVQMMTAEIAGKTLIFRSSSGTQGVVRAAKASTILAASFLNAEATLERIRQLKPLQVSFVITGHLHGGEEDAALADYLEHRLCGERVDAAPYLERVRHSPLGKLFASGDYWYRRKEDMEASCQLDRVQFAMEVFREGGQLVLRPVNAAGELLPLGARR